MRSVSERLRVVLDMKPLMKLFAEEVGWREVKEILSRVEAGELEAGISVVTPPEIYYKYLQEGRVDLAVARTRQLRYALYLKKLEVDEDVAVKAGEFKGKHNVSVADAFIAASAHSEGATVVSDDPDFKKISSVEVLSEVELYGKLQSG